MGSGQSLEKEVKTVVSEALGNRAQKLNEWANPDSYTEISTITTDLRKKGLESCNLIVGVDFTASNRHAGQNSFHGECLHALESKHGPNPYELSMRLVAESMKGFDEDGLIPMYMFGDMETRDKSVRLISPVGGCSGPDALAKSYHAATARYNMSGPTSFAPLIDEAVRVVKEKGNQMHVLLILADGQVSEAQDCLQKTKQAIVNACEVPLSIVMVGIGDGPWESMVHFDDDLPERDFDNFQFFPFVGFHRLLEKSQGDEKVHKSAEAAFALCVLQELPAQYEACKALHKLGTDGPPAAKRQKI